MEIKMGFIIGGKEATVGKIEVEINDLIKQGQILLNLETGKGNRPFKSTDTGIITKICVEEGDKVKTGDVLFEYTETKEEKNIDNFLKNDFKEKNIKKLETDLAIIGAGPGGYISAIYAAKKGLKVILIEKENLGGTCLNYGCIPTKTLIQSANIYKTIKNSDEFGIYNNDIHYNLEKIIQRKEKICIESREGINFLLSSNKVKLIKGEAVLEKNKNIKVTTKLNLNYLIKAENIILATGSKSIIPDWAKSSVCIDSKKALENFEVPKSVVVVGAGVIGMEFAFIYSSYGSKVKILEYTDNILGNLDLDAGNIIKESTKNKNICLETSAKVLKILKTEDEKAVIFYEKNGKEYITVADKVLIAIGRRPELNEKNLNDIGIFYNEKGIKTDENYETNIKGIYAVGDVNGKSQLAHSAYTQGISVIEKITNNNIKIKNIIPNVIFTSPEIASVGLTEKECEIKNIKMEISKVPFSINGKAKIQSETEGFIKLIKNKETSKIIGGIVVGPDASTIISSIGIIVANELTDKDIINTIFPHPTTAELLWEAAEGFNKGAIHYYE